MGRNYNKDLFKQLEEVLLKCDELTKELREVKETHSEETKELENRIKTLETENNLLREDNERMKRILNNNSSNSSLPPSSKQQSKSANTYNSREKSGKKQGGQFGHIGKTLTKEDVEEKIKSGQYAHKVINVGVTKGKYKSKYVIDLEIRPVVTEYRFYQTEAVDFKYPSHLRSEVTYGDKIKSMSVYLYSVGAVSNDRTCDFINVISDDALSVSTGSIYNFCSAFSKKCQPVIESIKTTLMNSPVVYTDATHVSTNGKQSYIRNQSTEAVVLYSAMETKSKAELKDTGIIGTFGGTLVHDHETALYNFGIDHAECNVHLLRYLKKNTEETGNSWSAQLKTELSKMNKQRKLRQHNDGIFSDEEIASYTKKFRDCLELGRVQHKQTKNKIAKAEEQRLLNRLEKYADNHLLFLERFDVGFDNNLSERDLRPCKTKDKVSGGFRNQEGAKIYANTMSVIKSSQKQGKSIFQSIKSIFSGITSVLSS